MSITIPRFVLAASLACFAPFTSDPTAQETAPEPVSVPKKEALVFYSAGLEELLSDPRDAGLLRALSALDERLLELPAELGADMLPPGLAELVLELCSLPTDLRADVVGTDEASGLPIVEAQLTMATGSAAGSVERAAGLANRLDGLLRDVFGIPFEVDGERPSFRSMEMPAGKAFFGGTSMDDGSGAFQIAWGEPNGEALDMEAFGLPAGVRPALAFSLDFAPLQGTIEKFLEEAGSEGAMLRRMFEPYGMVGKSPISMTMAVGHGEDRSHSVFRYGNWVSVARNLGAFVEQPLTSAEMRLVPADARMATLSKVEPHMVLSVFEMLNEDGVDIEEAVRSAIGIDLRTELLDYLGTTSGFYTSDSTGGGGLMSAVLFLSVVDAPGLAETVQKLAQLTDDLGQNAANGYVRTRRWEHAESICLTLTFPGLPIPLELSMAVSGDYLFAAATPQALVAALDHAHSDRPGLASEERFRAMASGSLDDLQSFTFNDVPSLIRDGYGLVSLLYAGLANGVRSRVDPPRDPGIVMPGYNELVAGAKPRLMLTRLDGEDLVMVGEGDRSFTANLCAEALAPVGVIVGVGLAATMIVPVAVSRLDALEAARPDSSFERDWIRSDLSALSSALDMYAIDNGGVYPAELHALLGETVDGPAYLDDEGALYDPWGFPYGYEAPTAERPRPRVFTLGADAEPGGEGSAQDVDDSMVRTGAY